MNQTQPIETGIAVIDLERMLGFYSRVLGCKEERRADIPGALSGPLGMAADGYLCVWMVTPVGERIKLMSPPAAPDKLDVPVYLTSRTGIAYLTFYCTGLHDILAAAEGEGAVLRSDRELIDPGRPLRWCFWTDPEGNVIELVEIDAG